MKAKFGTFIYFKSYGCKKFLDYLATTEEGQNALVKEAGMISPYKSSKIEPTTPLAVSLKTYVDSGNTSSWAWSNMPEGTFFRIIFPLMRPVQMTILILNGLWIWNDYLLPAIMLGLNGKIKTLPIAVSSFVGSYVKQ